MLESWLIIFIIIVVFMLIISVLFLEEQPIMCIPFIIVGMIFSVLCTYGMWNVEWVVVDSTDTLVIESTSQYGEPYSYVFYWIFMVFLILFVKAAFNTWRQALDKKEMMEIKKRNRYRI